MLTEEQVEHYYREGYVVVPGMVPLRACEAVMQVAPPPQSSDGQWEAKIFQHDAPDADAKLHRLLAEPSIIDAVTSIFEAPPRVFYGMLAIVAPNGGNGLPWHQDNQHTHILGGALNVFVALRDITPDMGILWMVPKSHLLGRQPYTSNRTSNFGYRETVVDPEGGICLPTLHAGDTCIFDRYTLHRSMQNVTQEPRYAYAAQYQAAHARVADTGKKDPMRMLATDLQAQWLRSGLLE
jgi:ectoine hydroxylase-related dioxygenase (phytanoyl-CoA dioxygenase family)